MRSLVRPLAGLALAALGACQAYDRNALRDGGACGDGEAGCDAGACGVGKHLCGTSCVADDSVMQCGATCVRCVAGHNATGVLCNGGACEARCATGYVANGVDCSVAPPRPIAPLSTATTTSARPTLRWKRAAGTTLARVQICADRACTRVEATGESIAAEQWTVPAALTRGLHYWRLFGRTATAVGERPGPVWEFFVAGVTTVDHAWGSVPDFDGDGLADIAIGSPGAKFVQIFRGRRSLPTTWTRGDVLLEVATDNDSFGAVLSNAGDVNGDGYADVLVGADRSDRAYLFYGGAGGPDPNVDVTLEHGAAGDQFGSAVSAAGDANGDGYADVLITERKTQRVLVYYGAATGFGETPTVLEMGIPGGDFGHMVASAGDANGDGFGDIAIAENGTLKVHFYLGSARGVTNTPATTVQYGTNNIIQGTRVGGAGDFNGDGFADSMVGSWSSCETNVYLGAATGVQTPATISLAPSAECFAFPGDLHVVGDINGDGLTDFVTGHQWYQRVYVHYGQRTASGRTPPSKVYQSMLTQFGARVAGLGDINGDGFADVLVTDTGNNQAWIYLGAAAGLATDPSTTLMGAGGFGSATGGAQ